MKKSIKLRNFHGLFYRILKEYMTRGWTLIKFFNFCTTVTRESSIFMIPTVFPTNFHCFRLSKAHNKDGCVQFFQFWPYTQIPYTKYWNFNIHQFEYKFYGAFPKFWWLLCSIFVNFWWNLDFLLWCNVFTIFYHFLIRINFFVSILVAFDFWLVRSSSSS